MTSSSSSDVQPDLQNAFELRSKKPSAIVAHKAGTFDGTPSISSHDPESYQISLRNTKSTARDAEHMRRMGHKQQMVRRFKTTSMVFFVSIATASWEFAVFTLNQGLIDGGRAGIIYSYVLNFLGFLPIILSMCEMASMAPVSGSQYHWVSEFAPEKHQKILSYFTGWMSTTAWQAGNAQGLFITGTLIQTCILVNNENYTFPRWQGTLLVIAAILLTVVANVYFTKWLPYTQTAVFVAHFGLYLCLIIPICIFAPKATAHEVFLEFDNLGGWPSMPLAVLAGQLTAISAMTGVDTAAHMSEEMPNASTTVPRTMIIAYIVNIFFSFSAIIAVLYGIPGGTEGITRALNDLSTYPVIYVLRQSMSKASLTALIAGLIVIFTASNIDYLAAVSRDLFAFARDDGVPLSKWIANVDAEKHVPVNALVTSGLIATVMSLIYLGSSTAFYALTSLFLVAILQCYMFSIGSILWRRVAHPESLPPCDWSLGRWGIPINSAALIYNFWAFFWSFWPQTASPNAGDFNWAIALFGVIVLGSGIYYIGWARKVYTGPVALVEGRGVVKI